MAEHEEKHSEPAAGHGEHDSHGAHQPSNPLDPNELFGHVEDSTGFHLPRKLAPAAHGHIEIPQPFKDTIHLQPHTSSELINKTIQPLDLKITKFMVIELLVAILIAVFFIGLGQALKGGAIARGRFRNMLEAMLLYFRDNVARPAIGHHDADRFVPFLWTVFFFVLGCNLFGMLPWMGSPTGSLAVTGAMSFITFLVVMGSAVAKLGPVGTVKSFVPHMDLPPALKIFLIPLIFIIEVMGMLIKHGVLAIRLLANMMAGHVVLAVIIAFIGAATGAIWYAVLPASLLGATALSLLELFVSFLQAYIFTFLTALFIGMAVHPH
jgi:F-type H+-transporting ATPase subunit a